MEIRSIIARQREYFQTGVTRSLAFRRAKLIQLLALLEDHETEILAALRADLGKSPTDAYAAEIGFVMGEIRYALRHLSAWMKPKRRRSPWMAFPSQSKVSSEPLGVGLIIGPWNYPLQLLLSPLVGAIAAGNCVVLKPSELAPHTAAVVDRFVKETFEECYIASILGGVETAEQILKERFDHIFFTGSTSVGREVMAAAAQHLTPVTLELGGKCPCLVASDARLDVTARRIVWGKFMNAGQTCVAPDYVMAHQSILPALVEEMKQALLEFYGLFPQESVDYGRIVHRGHLDRLSSYLQWGKIACGGEIDLEDLYVSPTILTDVVWDSPLMKEEIFGPILPVMAYSEIDEALNKIASKPSPLAIYLFSNDRELQERVQQQTRSGGVCVNDTILQILGHDLPFGGVGESGMGRYHGKASFDCFSHQRVVMRRWLMGDSRLRYPPCRISLSGMKRVLRWLG